MLQKQQLQGSLTLIKDGEYKVIPLTFSLENIQQIREKYKKLSSTYISCFTIEETDCPKLVDAFTLIDQYQQLLDEGYSILRNVPRVLLNTTFSNEIPNNVTCLIPEKISKEDQILLEKLFEETTNKNQATIISLCDNDFDFYVRDNFSSTSTEKVLHCFLEEKTNPNLSSEMKNMFQIYRDGDLSRVMLNTDYSRYPINNTGGGIIVITKDETFEKALRKRSHVEEFRKIMIELDSSLKEFEADSSHDFIDLINVYSLATIYYSTVGVFIFISNELNEYQYQTLMEKIAILHEVAKQRKEELNSNRDFYLSSKHLHGTDDEVFIQGLENIQIYLEEMYKNMNYSSKSQK